MPMLTIALSFALEHYQLSTHINGKGTVETL